MIKYIKQEMSPLNSNGKQDCFYRTERHGNMTHDDLVQQMSLGGMTKPQAEMGLARLKESMTELLLQGYSVSIDGWVASVCPWERRTKRMWRRWTATCEGMRRALR